MLNSEQEVQECDARTMSKDPDVGNINLVTSN